MQPALKSFLQRWVINTAAVLVAVYVVPGLNYEKPLDLFVAALVLGILNTFLRPVMMLLALPLVILTLGLFMLVINGVLLYFVSYLLRPHFYVNDFKSAVLGAVVISFVSLALNWLAGTGSANLSVKVERGPRLPPKDPPGGSGPIIDV